MAGAGLARTHRAFMAAFISSSTHTKIRNHTVCKGSRGGKAASSSAKHTGPLPSRAGGGSGARGIAPGVPRAHGLQAGARIYHHFQSTQTAAGHPLFVSPPCPCSDGAQQRSAGWRHWLLCSAPSALSSLTTGQVKNLL